MHSSALAGGKVQRIVKVRQLGFEVAQVAACASRGDTQCDLNGEHGCRSANGEDLADAIAGVRDTHRTTSDGSGWAITPAHGSFAAHPSRAVGVAEGATEPVVCVWEKFRFVS